MAISVMIKRINILYILALFLRYKCAIIMLRDICIEYPKKNSCGNLDIKSKTIRLSAYILNSKDFIPSFSFIIIS